MNWLMTTPLLGLDTETTGLDITHDRPVAIGLTWNHHGTHTDPPGFPLEPVHPGESHLPMSGDVIAIHGITDDRARSGAGLADALNATHRTIIDAARRGAVVVAGHARFDLSILASASRAAGVPTLDEVARRAGVPVWVLDPMVIDRWWDRHRAGRRRMRDLCDRYGVVNGHPHQAQSDARAAVDVARAVVALVCRPVEELGELATDPWCGARLAELRGCRTPGALHRLQRRWHEEHQEVRGGGRSGWPVGC